MRTSLGIWALGPMVTRFVPGGYQPELGGETTATRACAARSRASGGLIDDYEFHYPQELSPENLDDVREALGDHGIYCIATGLHLDPRFGRGGLVSPDPEQRAEALRLTLDAAEFAGSIGAHFIVWPGIEGYNYPFQTPYARGLAVVRRRDRPEAAEACASHGVKLFLEHKNSEPAMKILMRNVGMTLHVIHKLRAQGIDNVQVNMDWQHLIMNGESLAEYAALLAAEGLLGHQHANDGWGTFDDDNMVGDDPLHGDARAGARAASRRLRRARRAARLRPLSLHGGRRGGRAAERAAVALHRLGGGADRRARRCARRSRGRTRCAPTSWSTPRSAREPPPAPGAPPPRPGHPLAASTRPLCPSRQLLALPPPPPPVALPPLLPGAALCPPAACPSPAPTPPPAPVAWGPVFRPRPPPPRLLRLPPLHRPRGGGRAPPPPPVAPPPPAGGGGRGPRPPAPGVSASRPAFPPSAPPGRGGGRLPAPAPPPPPGRGGGVWGGVVGGRPPGRG